MKNKFFFNSLQVTFVILLALSFSSCRDLISDLSNLIGNEYHEVESLSEKTCLSSGTFTIPSSYFIVSEVRGKTVKPFSINQYEITYKLWYEVATWAKDNGYVFDNNGTEGAKGTEGAEPSLAKIKPVTNISWCDCVVWCNALSEKHCLVPVFYTDANYENILRSRLSSDGKTDNPLYIHSASLGNTEMNNCNVASYRLPTEAEWEYAARGGNADSAEWKYVYSGSNDWKKVCVANVSDVAPVGSLNSNSLGLYDFSGNLWEWVYDFQSSKYTLRGGCWANEETTDTSGNSIVNACRLSYKQFTSSEGTLTTPWFGFRVVRSLVE